MKKLPHLFPVILSVILYSCTTAYIPTELNTPAFHEQNQVKANLSYGSSGTNLQLGYSFYKNLGVTGDVSYLKTDEVFQRNWGLGLGYFRPLHKDKSVYGELFAGIHISETNTKLKNTDFTTGNEFERGKYYKIYLQPDISFPFGKNLDLIFAARLCYFHFTKYEIYTEENAQLPRALGMEPAFTIRLGTENVQLKYQLGLSLVGILSGSDFNYDKVFTHIGLGFSF